MLLFAVRLLDLCFSVCAAVSSPEEMISSGVSTAATSSSETGAHLLSLKCGNEPDAPAGRTVDVRFLFHLIYSDAKAASAVVQFGV